MSDKVLIVDDDHDLALMATLLARNAGFDAHTVHDGAAGLCAAETHRPDVILLDIMMHDMDGFEVHRRLKQNPDLAHIPVIFFSASVRTKEHQDPLAVGRSFLPKPFEGVDLVAAIKSAISASRCI